MVVVFALVLNKRPQLPPPKLARSRRPEPMLRRVLVLACLSAVASLVPTGRPVSSRRNALANAAAAAAAGVLAVRPAIAEDVKVNAAKLGVTPGGVKFFDKVTADTCSCLLSEARMVDRTLGERERLWYPTERRGAAAAPERAAGPARR